MWRALAFMTFLLLGVGLYAVVSGGAAAHAAAPAEQAGPGTMDFGFALAAGAVALGVTAMMTRPRLRYRR